MNDFFIWPNTTLRSRAETTNALCSVMHSQAGPITRIAYLHQVPNAVTRAWSLPPHYGLLAFYDSPEIPTDCKKSLSEMA